jgi:threonine/homoserine/homoserine lactone efflux protein
MDWHAFAFFLLTNLVLSLTPGPAVLLVTGHAASNGWRRAQASVLGIMSGNATYCLLSAFGLGMLFLHVPLLVDAVKIAGAAYLAFIAIRALANANQPLVMSGAAPVAPAPMLYRQALVLQLSNPKSVLFFCALLPQFVEPGNQAMWPMLALGFSAILLEYPVLCAYTALGAQATRLTSSPRAVRGLNVLSGGLLVLAAARVAAL